MGTEGIISLVAEAIGDRFRHTNSVSMDRNHTMVTMVKASDNRVSERRGV